MNQNEMLLCVNCQCFVSVESCASHVEACLNENKKANGGKFEIKRATIIKNANEKRKILKELNKYKGIVYEACQEIIALKTALKQKAVTKTGNHWVYDHPEWEELRYKTFRDCGFACMACNRIDEVLHIDHIKPLSRYPWLAFNQDNLQVLCATCNRGKGYKYHDNLRDKKVPDEFCL